MLTKSSPRMSDRTLDCLCGQGNLEIPMRVSPVAYFMFAHCDRHPRNQYPHPRFYSGHHQILVLCARGDLALDPAVGLLKAVAQTDGRLPAELLQDHGVVAVAAVDALRRA